MTISSSPRVALNGSVPSTPAGIPRRLDLRVGDVVEVRSREEILSTLDANGCLDELPFMPEMLAFCGLRFTVEKRADKTCDTVEWTGLRRLNDTVHLSETRCSGAAHGGCEAACSIFWKEAWLRPVGTTVARNAGVIASRTLASDAALQAATRRAESSDAEILYRCQATELPRFSRPLSPWDVGQYVRDVRSGNVTLGATLKGIAWRVFRWANTHVLGYRVQQKLFNHMQRLRGGMPNVILKGDKTKTPKETLDLRQGELVQVKTVDEIRDTLNPEQRNRGLYFDKEMTPFCRGTYTVRSRVTRIIEEKTGKMMQLPGDCILLDGVVCTGKYHYNCPRMIPSYWREIWLRRAGDDMASSSARSSSQ